MTQTIRSLADTFYAWMEPRKAPRTVEYYRSFLERWIAHVGQVDIGELRKHHLLTWAKTWHETQAVQRLFAWATHEAEFIQRNPFKGMKLPKPRSRQRILTDREYARMLGGSRADFRRFLMAMRESIARPQEIRAVRWEWIRWEGDHQDVRAALVAGDAFFELWEFKSRKQRADQGTPRRILINQRLGRLVAFLGRRLVELRGEIFLNRCGKPWTANATRLRMKRLVRGLGIELDCRGEPIVNYTLRHTAATQASAQGVSDRILAEVMGHTSTRTTQRYCHPTRRHIRDAMHQAWSTTSDSDR